MLDSLEKISKIVFTGIASTVIAVAGLSVEWEKLGLEEDSWCFEHSDRAQDAILRRTETIPDLLIRRYSERCDVSFEQAARVLNEERVIAELSDPTLDSGAGSSGGASDDSVGDGDGDPTSGSGGGTPDTGGGSGDGTGGGSSGGTPPGTDQGTPNRDDFDSYVALGRTQPTSYAQVNFNIASNSEPSIADGSAPDVGTVLVARWSVNLRGNTTVTTAGRNPILSVIDEGECVLVVGTPEVLRGQYWAAVDRTDCP